VALLGEHRRSSTDADEVLTKDSGFQGFEEHIHAAIVPSGPNSASELTARWAQGAKTPWCTTDFDAPSQARIRDVRRRQILKQRSEL